MEKLEGALQLESALVKEPTQVGSTQDYVNALSVASVHLLQQRELDADSD
jgi:hypothetical protein